MPNTNDGFVRRADISELIADEKKAAKQYGSSHSGASSGDILGAALKSGE